MGGRDDKMAYLQNGFRAPGVGGASPGSASPTPVSTEYEANRPQMMPVYNSPSSIESARRKRNEIISRSGRGSTNLVGNPGTQAYSNSFLGSVT